MGLYDIAILISMVIIISSNYASIILLHIKKL